ncbi:MAG: adaptor protein MecA [Clostridia bacterium]|nr:adaptor protein MecA [Clostridia bacterium]
MDITYINSNNIKVTLSKVDLSDKGLEAQSIDYSNTKTKRFIWEILDIAYVQTGFDTCNCKLYVRIFPGNDGGCELFITKKECKAENRKNTSAGTVCILYNCELLYTVCKRLLMCGFSGKTSLYNLGDNFILLCNNEPRLPSYMKQKKPVTHPDLSFLSEYGDVLPLSDEILAYISEYCNCICSDDAAQKLTR